VVAVYFSHSAIEAQELISLYLGCR